MTAQATHLNRPKGFAPRGTSLGFVGFAALAIGIPFTALQCAAPLSTGGFDRWLDSLPFVLVAGVLPSIIVVIGLRSRRYWLILFFFYYGLLLLVGFGLDLGFAIASAAGVLPVFDPGLRAMGIVGLVMVVLLAPAAWLLSRALRLRYWQPGSAPETWEAGDERPAKWAMSPARSIPARRPEI